MGFVPVRACGGIVRGRNRAGHKIPARAVAHSRSGSGHCRQSGFPRVSLSDRRGRRSSARLFYGSDCSPSLARMALIGWNGGHADDAIACCDARACLDDWASPVGGLAIPTARVGRTVADPGGTRGPCLVVGAVVMAPCLAVRTAGSRSCGTGVRNDDRLSVCHDHCTARLCCTLVGRSPWSDGVNGRESCGGMGGHGGGSVRRGHAVGAGGKPRFERHRADVSLVCVVYFVCLVYLVEP